MNVRAMVALVWLGLVLLAGSAGAQTNKLWKPGTFTDGDSWRPPCGDCYVQQVEVMVPRTGIPVNTPDPGCGGTQVIDLAKIAQAALKAQLDPASSGNLVELTKRFVFQEVRSKVGGSVGSFLDANGPKSSTGLCAPLAAILPNGADVVTVHLGDWDNNVGVGGCPPPPGECSNGWAKFYLRPELVDGDQPVVMTAFINWSHDRDRVARMFVAYRMPPGKKVLDVS